MAPREGSGIATSTSPPSGPTGNPDVPRGDFEGPSLGLVLNLAREHLGVDALFLTQIKDGFELFVLGEGDVEGFGPIVEGGRLPLDESICDRILRDRLPNVIADAAASPTLQTLAITHEAGIGSYVGIPVRLPDGTVYGTFCCVSHRRDRLLADEDLELMTLLARLVGEEIERRRVSAAVMAAEHRVGRLLAEWRTVDSLLAGVLTCLRPVFESDAAAAWLTGADGANPERRIADGPDAAQSPVAQLGDVAARALATGLPAKAPSGDGTGGLVTDLAVPLCHAGQTLGVLEWSGKATVKLDRHAERRLGRIGGEVGAALARVALPAGRGQPSARELQVLQLAANGYGARETAADLHVSPATVRTHLRHLYAKLEVSDRAAAVAVGLRHRLIV